MLTESASGENLALVKDSLFSFITSHIPDADLSVIDDIILSYVYSTFEGGSEDFYSQLNDVVADFLDMMSAYVANFNKISQNAVSEWMLETVHCLDERQSARDSQEAEEARSEDSAREAAAVEAKAVAAENAKKGGSRSSSTSEDENELREKAFSVSYDDVKLYHQCKLLMEIFPWTNPMEVKHCMSIAFGDIDDASEAIIHRRDSGQSIECNAWQVATKVATANDAEIKNRIISRYSYVDKESESKEHKPLTPKNEPKKLVRYRDNKIVSLKGERFTEVSKTDEECVKKTNKKNHP